MKKIGILVFIGALVIGSIISNRNSDVGKFNFFSRFGKTKGSGNLKAENRNVSNFREIEANGAINLEVSVQQEYALTIEADDNLLEFIKTEVEGDTLKIYSEGKFSMRSKINVKISLPELERVKMNGASNAVIANIKSDTFRLEANGASKIKATGEISEFEADANGASRIDAEELKMQSANVNANGASSIMVSAVNRLEADASGASTVIYSGEPQVIDKRSSGASSIKKK